MNSTTSVSTPEKRPVLGRVVLFWTVYLLILICVGFLKQFLPQILRQIFWGLFSSAGIIFVSFLFIRQTGKPPSSFGFGFDRFTVGRLALGWVIGSFIPCAILGITALVSGGFSFVAVPVVPAALVWNLVAVLALSGMEELGFRGYPLHTLHPVFDLWESQFLVAGAFAVCHTTFGWSWWTVVTGVFPAGLVFGMSALASGGLAMPIALHAAVNFTNWLVGTQERPGLLKIVVADEAKSSVGRISTFASIAVELLVVLLFWLYWSRKRKDGGLQGAKDARLPVNA